MQKSRPDLHEALGATMVLREQYDDGPRASACQTDWSKRDTFLDIYLRKLEGIRHGSPVERIELAREDGRQKPLVVVRVDVFIGVEGAPEEDSLEEIALQERS